MIIPSHRPLLAAALLLLAAGCATTQTAKPETKPVAAAPAPVKPGEQPKISSRAQLLFEDANKAYEAQRRAKAYDYPALERKFQIALDADPQLAEAQFNLGVLAERQGRADDAVKRYQAALKTKPSLKAASENLAVISQNRGDVPGAVWLYKGILEQYPDDAASRARLAEIYRQQGDHEHAMELARQALMREPKSLAAYKVMMLSLLDRKQLAMAKLVALRALKIDESDPELYHTVGLILLQDGDSTKAQAQFRKAVDARADYLPSRMELAKLALKDENFVAAEEHLRRVLQVNGKSAEAHLNLGVCYKGMGQLDKAMQEYDAAEKLDPNLSAIYLNRGIILLRHKDAPDKAEEYFKKYVSLSGAGVVPADAPVLALLKEAEALLQARAEAKRMEEEAKKLETAQKAQQERLKQAEGDKGAPPPPGGKAPAGDGKVVAAKGTEGKAEVKPASGTAPAPAPEQGKAPPPPPAGKAPPAAPPASSDEPKDEPSDAL